MLQWTRILRGAIAVPMLLILLAPLGADAATAEVRRLLMALQRDEQDLQDHFTQGIAPYLQRTVQDRVTELNVLGNTAHPDLPASLGWDELAALGYTSRTTWPSDESTLGDLINRSHQNASRALRAEGYQWVPMPYTNFEVLGFIGREVAKAGRLVTPAEFDTAWRKVLTDNRMMVRVPAGFVAQPGTGNVIPLMELQESLSR